MVKGWIWSKGGYGPKWGKNPKIWSGIDPLKNHIIQFVFTDYYKRRIIVSDAYKDCQVIDVTTGNVFTDLDIYQHMYDYISRERKPDYPVIDKRFKNV